MAILGSGAALIGAIAAFTMRETYRVPLAELGKPERVPAGQA